MGKSFKENKITFENEPPTEVLKTMYDRDISVYAFVKAMGLNPQKWQSHWTQKLLGKRSLDNGDVQKMMTALWNLGINIDNIRGDFFAVDRWRLVTTGENNARRMEKLKQKAKEAEDSKDK